ncbi:hypothetical protein F7725_002372 [Dissostichus mawsoni]|uniref:Secreted protein n=1 Tax=Dissostichus mawsoni TaxID=36200 RepID=A0A7J5Y377_DISMA|nr:hypothetical protein F7725_002372 [Dissostichus mawsoni]
MRVQRVLVVLYLWSVWVRVEFFHQVHAAFGVDRPVDDSVPQAHLLQVNSYDLQHAGPLGHDDATHDQRGETTRAGGEAQSVQLLLQRQDDPVTLQLRRVQSLSRERPGHQGLCVRVHVQQVVLDGGPGDGPACTGSQLTDGHGGLHLWVFDAVAFVQDQPGPGHSQERT